MLILSPFLVSAFRVFQYRSHKIYVPVAGETFLREDRVHCAFAFTDGASEWAGITPAILRRVGVRAECARQPRAVLSHVQQAI